jgi:hypothetical protein
MTPVEQRVLLQAIEVDPDVYQMQRFRDLWSEVPNLDNLIHLAIEEGVAGLLFKNLLKLGALERLGNSRKERLRSVYYQTLLWNMKLINDLDEVLNKVNENRFEVVLLQGIVLLEQVYDDVGLRPMSDIDLWVLSHNFPQLADILVGLGYERDPVYPHTFKRGTTIFDIHTNLLWADRIRSRNSLLCKDQESIYRAAKKVIIGRQEALSLSQEDQVLYLSLHALKHNVGRLIWLVDIKCCLTEWQIPDWLKLLDRAREMGQEKALSRIIYLLHILFGFCPPLEIKGALERAKPNLLEAWILRLRAKKGPLPVWTPVLLLSPGNGLKKHLILIIETLFPRPDILRQVFADTPAPLKVWQLYWRRVLQLFGLIRMSLRGF